MLFYFYSSLYTCTFIQPVYPVSVALIASAQRRLTVIHTPMPPMPIPIPISTSIYTTYDCCCCAGCRG